MAVAANADLYTNGRVGIYFPAHNQTSADGNLTGQCVTLVKWFMAEMASVPSPFAARGDAKNVGKSLVAQGHATEVPFSQRRRGDIICYEYGTYGHTAVQLSGGNVFESNINWSGVPTKIVYGERVYASRIGNENESWRVGKNPHVYRLKTYNEGGGTPAQGGNTMAGIPNANNYYWRYGQKLAEQVRGRQLSRTEFERFLVGQSDLRVVEILSDDPEADRALEAQRVGQLAIKDNWQGQIYSLVAQVNELNKRPTQAQLDALNKQAGELKTSADAAQEKADDAVAKMQEATEKAQELQAQADSDKATGDSVLRQIGRFFSKYFN